MSQVLETLWCAITTHGDLLMLPPHFREYRSWGKKALLRVICVTLGVFCKVLGVAFGFLS